jgi:hypothetical protein
MERPGGIRAARYEVVREGNINGLPAALEGELKLILIKNIVVEVAGAVKEEKVVDGVLCGILRVRPTGEERNQKNVEHLSCTHPARLSFRNQWAK